MPGSITPLPIMLEDEEELKRFAAKEPPKTVVCRYGYMKLVAELPYGGTQSPGCGTKLVIRTQRGIELAEMLTTTCANAGCGKSVTRKEMLKYIEASGGKDYPFSTRGKALRIATHDDLHEQAVLDAKKSQVIKFARTLITELDLPMKLVEVERLLGGERMIFHYTSQQWVDFRELVRRLASEYQTRIEMHQVNARDEARLTADYEKCGQHCCCKQFLKVLKPVSMRSAKVQKATLDPAKISGRCGRLMCCLRYEDQTYESLRKRLPHRQTRVMTDDGPGTVVDTQILTQLVLVQLDSGAKPAAYPLENTRKLSKEEDKALKEKAAETPARPTRSTEPKSRPTPAPSRHVKPKKDEAPATDPPQPIEAQKSEKDPNAKPKRRRGRRRRRRRRSDGPGSPGSGPAPSDG